MCQVPFTSCLFPSLHLNGYALHRFLLSHFRIGPNHLQSNPSSWFGPIRDFLMLMERIMVTILLILTVLNHLFFCFFSQLGEKFIENSWFQIELKAPGQGKFLDKLEQNIKGWSLLAWERTASSHNLKFPQSQGWDSSQAWNSTALASWLRVAF